LSSSQCDLDWGYMDYMDMDVLSELYIVID
jgi:hypothetical protein